MKIIFILLAMIFIYNSSAVAYVCPLDLYFNKTIDYRTYQTKLSQIKMDRQDNNYSFLPEFSLSSGQSAYNKSGFKSPEYSSAGIYISMPIYSGGKFFLNNKKLLLSDDLQEIAIEKDRITYILSIYERIIRRKEVNSLLKEYQHKQKEANIENKRLQYFFEQGSISAFELSLKKNIAEDHQKNIRLLKNELQHLEWELEKKYVLPQNMFESINSSVIKLCKKDDISFLIKKENAAELEEANINFDLEKTADYPSVSLSFGLIPKNGGTIRDISIDHGSYAASVNLNIPLSGLLKLIAKKEKHLLSLASVKLNIDKRNIELETAKQEVLNKLNNATDELSYLKNQISINKNKVNYLKERLKNNNNILQYYNEINALNEIERNLRKKENEIELYKMHMFFIG
ncbi:TPA: TolC family protein [Escherichia coli]|uniref:TolC family protein n=5 Tax=Escherichia coli TaxID=562 RepID=UPI0002C8EA83|nr:TolC family protein [Escherichia coli]EEW0750695.1 TolC family protein [Escherichia coli]EEZ4956690.1 TolC family protein [Escherichia coli]EFB1332133.1 TolC family protein [Escherichia coli]EFB2335434.1 TolC family protein [Escherichia coli]EFC7463927.1 TolC family protein [Escherichia coli]